MALLPLLLFPQLPTPDVTPATQPIRFNHEAPALIRIAPKPDYDKQVLEPLHEAQERLRQEAEAKARQAALEAAQREQAIQAAKEAQQQAEATQAAPPAPTMNVGGSHEDWMAAAGIAPTDYGYVDFIISHESGWRYTASNPSSAAYGFCQSLPASKMSSAGSDWETNPVTQLRWCNGYAMSRYNGWLGAYNFWTANSWW